MAECLVLGANGFIGSHVVDELVAAGHSVRCFDRFGGDQEPAFDASDRIELYKGDFLNRSDLSEALSGAEYVFHFISTTTPITAENNPIIDIETNIKQSVELFQECVNKGVQKVIFASTGGAIYGSTEGQPIPETTLPQPFSPYAIGKLAIEHYLRYFEKKFGMDSVVYRISNPYGERQPLHSKQGVIPIFLQQISNGEPITVLGDGSMVRDYVYVKDVAKMIVGSFLEANKPVYNLGSGQGITVNELVSTITDVVDRPVDVTHKEVPATFVDRVILDTSLFQDEFNIPITVELEEGVRRTWDYVLRKQGGRNK
jgi:UDP-glucose 4-epimerase